MKEFKHKRKIPIYYKKYLNKKYTRLINEFQSMKRYANMGGLCTQIKEYKGSYISNYTRYWELTIILSIAGSVICSFNKKLHYQASKLNIIPLSKISNTGHCYKPISQYKRR